MEVEQPAAGACPPGAGQVQELTSLNPRSRLCCRSSSARLPAFLWAARPGHVTSGRRPRGDADKCADISALLGCGGLNVR